MEQMETNQIRVKYKYIIWYIDQKLITTKITFANQLKMYNNL